MKKTPGTTVSARGEMIDFDLIRTREELNSGPITIQRTTPTRKRRKLSDRIAMPPVEAAPEQVATIDAEIEAAEVTTTMPPAQIVRRKKS